MQKIIISISELSQSNWILIYKFINGIIENKLQENVFNEFLDIANVTITNKALDKDAYSAYGEKLTFKTRPPDKDVTFSIIYQKLDEKEDFSDIVPYFLLKRKFAEKITLGIDVGKIPVEKNKQNAYAFKCSDFLRFIEDKKPLLGQRSIYFINAKAIDKETGEIRNFSDDFVTSLVGKGKSNEKTIPKYTLKASRRFLPLLKINKKNFHELFGIENTARETKEAKNIEESVEKLSADLNISKDKYNSLFEEWFIKAYFYSLDRTEQANYKELKNILHTYCNSIYELAQNIIFHGGEEGLIYFVFNKKENITETQQKNIPGFDSYVDRNQRFVEIGVFDFNTKGIVENYIENFDTDSSFMLDNFFNPKSVFTGGLNHLELRYAAHLGIKSFVKSVLNHNGYFNVESSFKGKKQRVESLTFSNNKSNHENNTNNEEFASGTHYRIILPVNPVKGTSNFTPPPQTQKKSFIEKLRNRIEIGKMSIRHIRIHDILDKYEHKYKEIQTKEDQKQYIISIGDELLKEVNSNEIAIDLSAYEIDINFIFKLLSYIQLTNKTTFEKIILTHISKENINSFCNKIKDLLINNDIKPIWSKNSALILVSTDLHYQIICGETTDELYYLNNEFQKHYYPSENFFENGKDPNNKELAEKFVLPYEVLIENNKSSYFEQYALNILKEPIESDKMGYRLSHENTYIGSKLILKNYYEADSMFQNSFFAERFAYLIAKEAKLSIKQIDKEKVVILGYKPYSNLLVKKVKKLLGGCIKSVVIANEDSNGEDLKFIPDKSLNYKEQVIKEGKEIETDIDFKYITVVPIAATLTTNDKIIAFYKRHIKEENNLSEQISADSFIYNHCAIVVRDKLINEPTEIEQQQKWDAGWKKIIDEKVIKTTFVNAKKVHFSLQVVALKDEYNWLPRLNEEVSFPKDWQKEQYVNFTENSSINSQNLMGYPKVSMLHKEDNDYDYEIELDRLQELKENIFSGHIECHKSHYLYYIDTETFIKRENKREFDNWKNKVSDNEIFKNDFINVIITPGAKRETDFVETINEGLFSGDALIIYLDVSNWRNNIIHKLSFLQQLYNSKKEQIKFHYVDHALLTSETYKKVKSYLFSILKTEDECHFRSIITLINRLSYDRYKEITKGVEKVFTFLNLFVPASKDPERDCSLCMLMKHYEKLKENTVLESCNNVISRNMEKIRLKEFNKTATQNRDENKNKENSSIEYQVPINGRKFMRLILTHHIHYLISNIKQEDISNKDKEKSVYDKLDKLYTSKDTKLDKWHQEENKEYLHDVEEKSIQQYNIEKFEIDKKISFLKVISSPPLSQYIKIRKYAHEKLIAELSNILPKKSNGAYNFKKDRYKYNDIRVLKVVLKSLSFLKSNALVRKDVIIGAWILCFKVMEQLQDEQEELNQINEILKNKLEKLEERIIQNELKNELHKDSFKKQLEKQKKFFSSIKIELEKELENLNSGKDNLIMDFQADFQFFIKNAVFEDESKAIYIGELLRTGEEVSLPISNTFSISETISGNKLFKQFEEKKYTEFLIWLFYDNTTIIRRAIQNFKQELDKDLSLKQLFMRGNSLAELKNFNEVRDQEDITSKFIEKVEKEYYYSNLKHYLKNKDDINFIEKLVYVLFAQQKLKELNKVKGKTVESDIKSVLEIFAAIMSADAAFLSMNKEEKFNRKKEINVYPVSQYNKNSNDIFLDIDKMVKSDYFHTIRVIKEKSRQFKFPFIPKYEIKQNSTGILYAESTKCNAQHINHFLLYNNTSNQTDLIGAITFLYKNNYSSEEEFRMKIRESGRLLLLLKSELNKYVIDYLINEKVFDLWVKEKESERKFQKIYLDSDHSFGALEITNEIDFDKLDNKNLETVRMSYLSHTNKIINHLYSSIEKGYDGKYRLLNDIDSNDENNIANIINDKFYEFLRSFITNKNWKGNLNKDFSKLKENATTSFNKQLLRTFVIQCLDNAMAKHFVTDNKDVLLKVTNNQVTIISYKPNTDNFNNRFPKDKIKFKTKKESIKAINKSDYSCMTLTVLQAYCNEYGFSCDYDFDDNYNFITKISLN